MATEMGSVAPARWWTRAGSNNPQSSGEDLVFSPRIRRAGVIWTAITVPLVMLSGLFVHGETAYLVGWVLLSGLYTTPAIVFTVMASRRAAPADRLFWRLWSVGMVFVYLTGVSILLLAFTGSSLFSQAAGITVVTGALVFTLALVMMMRSRSGSRTLSLDLTEGAMLFVGIVAVAVLVVGEQVMASPSAWFTVPAAIACVGLLLAIYWAASLFGRLDGSCRQVEAVGMTLAICGAVNSALQAAQGMSGFTLPAAPLFGMQALCMALLMLMPLNVPKHAPVGLERLPPHAQVRESGVTTVLALLLLSALLFGAFVVHHDTAWTATVFTGVVAALFVLSTLRHLLTTTETKRLYAQVEAAAEERRQLLSDVMESADQDRHRVAAQLHEQAVSSYVAFSSYIQSTGGIPAGDDGSPHATALAAVRDDLAHQAESLRQLMLAVRPLEVDRPGPKGLTIAISAYVDGLYGDGPVPDLDVDIDDDLVLGWTTETMVFRIIQEALRNVQRHARATSIRISIRYGDDGITVRVADNGIGFNPETTMFESGIATMRSFAAFGGGTVEIDSAPGQGTDVNAVLSTDPPVTPRPPQPRVGAARPGVVDLRLIEGGAGRDDHSPAHI